ncbi:hypothetical protein BKP42_67740 [Rhodococcus erythropolis]|nr:hypothetical protein BKP42_67740 [Rhodococcus erythropolis]
MILPNCLAQLHLLPKHHDVDHGPGIRGFAIRTARHAGVPTDVVEAAALVSQCTHELMLNLGEEFTDGIDGGDSDEQRRDVHHHAARAPQHRRGSSGHRNMNLDSLFRCHPREVQRERSDDRCSVVLGFVEKGTAPVRHQCAFESALDLRGPRSLRQAGSGDGGIALSPVLPVCGESIRHSVPLVDVV